MSLNITPHIPQVVVNASVPSTESLARSNAIKEVVPAPVPVEASVPRKSREQDTRPPIVDSGFDKSTYDKTGQTNNQVIPDDPQAQQEGEQGRSQQDAQDQGNQPADGKTQDTSNEQGDDSRSDTDNRAEKEYEQKVAEEEREQIQQLSSRDTEVRNHEMAHAAVGGSYAGSPSYEYQTGPDGKKYAVGGEVSIDVSKAATPEDTIEKMKTVIAAALAPAEPSAQDRKVAAQATQNITEARVEMVRATEEKRQAIAEAVGNSFQANKTSQVIENKYNSSYVDETIKSTQFSAVA